MTIGMGKTRTKPKAQPSSRQILTDAKGHATHVVMTVEEFQEMEELIDDLRDLQDYYQTKDTEQNLPWEEVKKSLGV